jgi:Peptidase family S41
MAIDSRQMILRSACAALVVATFCSHVLADTSDGKPSWSAILRMDAQAMHDDIAANHPGPVDSQNPGFAQVNEKGLTLALKRATTTHDYADYWYAMSAYAASFDDGHLRFSIAKGAKPPVVPLHWPGFLTGFAHDGAQRVISREEHSPLPLGARLIACDGIPADHLASEDVGAFVGRWQLYATRIWGGQILFVDQQNPWIQRPEHCRFDVDGQPRSIALDWKPISDDELAKRRNQAWHRASDPIGMRVLTDGTVWIGLSDFDGDPNGAASKALVPLIAELGDKRALLIKAPAIVLDVRGNNGGSSDWSVQIARVIWGKHRVDQINASSDAVDWRASTANIATLQALADKQRASKDASHDVLVWFESVIDGMKKARAEGKTFYHVSSEDDAKPAPTPDVEQPRGKVFMVTDAGCASACLDAADLWLALGAIQVGEETSADTLYMDIRKDDLPSGIGHLALAMKVYRGRPRGNNVPLHPTFVFPGEVSDTAALEKWIATLRATPSSSQ